MAVVNENSTEYAQQIATGAQTFLRPDQFHGRLRIVSGDFTRAAQGDAGSLCNMIRLPAGNVRLILGLSYLTGSAYGAARTLDLGWAAYNDFDTGAAVAADPNGLDDGVDVSSAWTLTPGGTVGGAEEYLFQSRDGVILTAQVNDGTWDAAETMTFRWAYVAD